MGEGSRTLTGYDARGRRSSYTDNTVSVEERLKAGRNTRQSQELSNVLNTCVRGLCAHLKVCTQTMQDTLVHRG